MKDPKKVLRGKKSRASGSDFERRVRADLEFKGWTVDKFSSNIEEVEIEVKGHPEIEKTIIKKLMPAKHKFRGNGIPMAMGTGFPDFIAFRNLVTAKVGMAVIMNVTCEECRKTSGTKFDTTCLSEIIGVECKTNGKLDKTEKEKCRWLLNEKIFSKILIARKEKDGRKIIIKYDDFNSKYG